MWRVYNNDADDNKMTKPSAQVSLKAVKYCKTINTGENWFSKVYVPTPLIYYILLSILPKFSHKHSLAVRLLDTTKRPSNHINAAFSTFESKQNTTDLSEAVLKRHEIRKKERKRYSWHEENYNMEAHKVPRM